jgi:hypothetical protein
MKKILLLTAVLGILTSLSPGCDDDSDNQILTLNDLVGNWLFVSLDFNGKTTTDCDSALNKSYDWVTLSMKNMSTTSTTLYSSCTDAGNLWEQTFGYTLIDNVISLSTGVKFNIEGNSTPTTLIIKLTDPGIATKYPVGGIYTLNKDQ